MSSSLCNTISGNVSTHQRTSSAGVSTTVDGASRDCNWRFSFIGCLCVELTTFSRCGVEGCNRLLHHACQAEWELAQYKRESGDDANPFECRYDSSGLKRCMKHHPYSDVALSGVAVDDDGYPV